ncbi:MAG: acetyltransferase [Cyclobacteriaceae bacterium]|nr:acetyltransferase [Cyclobacteriaceae bacterium]
MKKPLFIYGSGGLGKEVLSMMKVLEDWEPRGFFDDGKTRGSSVKNLPVMGGWREVANLSDDDFLILAIGNPQLKRELVEKISVSGKRFATVVHPAAILQEESTIALGEGTIVTAGVVLTCDIQIGQHVLLNLNATIGHDTTVGNFSSVMPGVNISGEVKIGEGVMIGSGASILNRVQVGNSSRVGMGSVVLWDVEAHTTVAGVPANKIK